MLICNITAQVQGYAYSVGMELEANKLFNSVQEGKSTVYSNIKIDTAVEKNEVTSCPVMESPLRYIRWKKKKSSESYYVITYENIWGNVLEYAYNISGRICKKTVAAVSSG